MHEYKIYNTLFTWQEQGPGDDLDQDHYQPAAAALEPKAGSSNAPLPYIIKDVEPVAEEEADETPVQAAAAQPEPPADQDQQPGR